MIVDILVFGSKNCKSECVTSRVGVTAGPLAEADEGKKVDASDRTSKCREEIASDAGARRDSMLALDTMLVIDLYP